MPPPESIVHVMGHEEPSVKVVTTEKGAQGEVIHRTPAHDRRQGERQQDARQKPAKEQEVKSTTKWSGKALDAAFKLDMQGNVFDVNDSWKLSDDGKVTAIVRDIKTAQGDTPDHDGVTKQTVAPLAFAPTRSFMWRGLYWSRFVAASRRSHVDGRGTRGRNCGSGRSAITAIFGASTVFPGRPGALSRPFATDPNRERWVLFQANDPADHFRGYDFARDIEAKAAADERYAKASQGVMDFKKVSYRSGVGDMDIPAYLFQPLETGGAERTRGDGLGARWRDRSWGVGMFPFVREAVQRGYVIIAPVSRQHRIR